MQGFDSQTLVREEELGKSKNFKDAVEPAERLIALYCRLSVAALQDFPDDKLREVQNRANADFRLFQDVLNFHTDRTTLERDDLITGIRNAYNGCFITLHPLIAYSLHRSADFQRLDSDARGTLQTIQDRAQEQMAELEKVRLDAGRILEEVRTVAAEAGVSQQASFFRLAAEEHEERAQEWHKTTITLAWGMGAFAVASFFIHKIPFIAPTSAYETIQIAVSKILVFAVLSFMLYLSARSFLSHNHNAIVNRHRQHALMTYRALVEAAGDTPHQEVVLTHAAACIFSPQATGYSADGREAAPHAKSVVEFLGATLNKG